MIGETRQLQGDSGFATPQVVVVAAVLAAISLSIVQGFRSFVADARFRQASIVAETRAEAGLERCTLATLRASDPIRGELVSDGRKAEWSFDESVVLLALESETSKINVRLAQPEIVTILFSELGLSTSQVAELREALKSVQAGSVPSLRLAFANPRITDLAGHRLDRYLTIESGTGGVDPWMASEPILMSLGGIDRELVRSFLAKRDALRTQPDSTAIAEAMLGPTATSLFAREASTFTCRAMGRASGGGTEVQVGLARVFRIDGAETGQPTYSIIDQFRSGR